ncbi:MAG: Wzz/FepE/Etk N-terminal domain-containing protein, partial [Candidatus Hydrogenedentota bacterium]
MFKKKIKKIYIFLFIVILCIIIGLIYTINQPYLYESRAEIRVEEIEGGEVLKEILPTYRITSKTLRDIIYQEKLLEKVAKNIKPDEKNINQFIREIKRSLFVTLRDESENILLVCRWQDARVSADILKIIIDNLKETINEKNKETQQSMTRYLIEKVEQTKRELSELQLKKISFEQLGIMLEKKEELSAKLQRYNDILDRLDEEYEIKASDFQKKYPAEKYDKIITLKYIMQTTTLENPASINIELYSFEEYLTNEERIKLKPFYNLYYLLDIELTAIKREIDKILKKYNEDLKVYKTQHPLMIEQSQLFTSTRKKLKDFEKKKDALIIHYLRTLSKTFILKKKTIEIELVNIDDNLESYAALKKELAFNGILSKEDFDNEIKMKESMLFSMVDKLEYIRLNENAKLNTMSVLTEPDISQKPVSPDKKFNISIAFIIGVVIGTIVIFVLGFLEKGYRGMEENAGLNVLATIPDFKITKYGLIVKEKSLSSVAEDFRTLRNNIMFLFRGKISFVITSSLPAEGKTTILANLALTFAEIEKRTLILSCNLRNPQLHKYFRINNNSGITDW